MRVLISDLDGTLLDVQDRTARAHEEALVSLGYSIDLDRIRSLYQSTLHTKELLTRLNIQLSSREIIQYIEIIRDIFYKNWQHSHVIPGVPEALEGLCQKTDVMRLISSRWRIEATRQEVRRFGLNRFFDKVLTRGDLAREEGVDRIPLIPFVAHRRRLVRLAIQDLDHPHDVWVLGDTPGELEAAWSLGFVTVGVLTGIGTRDDLAPFAHHILESVAEIGHLI